MKVKGCVDQKSNMIFLILFVGFFFWAIFCAGKKQGFYIDEYYTYTLTNGTHLGIDIQNGEWNSTKPFFQELVVDVDRRFDFAQVYKNTADDVHPPLYYWVLNVITSFFPGSFSMWYALTINIGCFMICIWLLYLISMHLTDDRKFSFLLLFVYAINPSTITGIVYLRMYYLLSVFTYAYILEHILMIEEDKISIKRVSFLFAIGLLGFITHYYMLFVMFFVSFFFALYFFLFRKKYWETIFYGMGMMASLVVSYVVWPYSYFHMFKGYRGKEAIGKLMNTGDLFRRGMFFLNKLNEKVFSSIGIWIAIALGIFSIYCIGTKKIQFRQRNLWKYIIPLCAVICYFILVSFTALATVYGIRYEFPIIGILLLYVLKVAVELLRSVGIPAKATFVGIGILFLLVSVKGYLTGTVDFLYPQQIEINQYIAEHQESDVIVFERGTYDSLIGDLVQFPEVFFAGVDETEQLGGG